MGSVMVVVSWLIKSTSSMVAAPDMPKQRVAWCFHGANSKATSYQSTFDMCQGSNVHHHHVSRNSRPERGIPGASHKCRSDTGHARLPEEERASSGECVVGIS